jgi:3-hydroxyacyl-[acyl-carrier-protein] dehydratase
MTEALFPIDVTKIMTYLPHRYPMLMVDKIISAEGKTKAIGIKNVTFNEPHFMGHFPGAPVMPGVLIIEAMAQTAAAFVVHVEQLDSKDKLVYFMSIDEAKFRKPVVPGDVLEIHVEVLQNRRNVWKFRAEGKVNGAVCAEATYSAMLVDRPE